MKMIELRSTKNKNGFFKRNKNIIIFLSCICLLIIIISTLLKFNIIARGIGSIKAYNNEALTNIINKIENIEIYNNKTLNTFTNKIDDTENNEIISFVNEEIKKSLNKRISSTKLIYNALLDGDSAKQFHKKCDGYNNTLTIIKTDKGKIFGGFTTLSWESQFHIKEGDKGFIFNYNKKKIYYKKKDSKIEIITNSDFGPGFGNADLVVVNGFLGGAKSYDQTSRPSTSYDTNGKEYALNDEYYFKVLNLFVYELIFE